MNTPLDGLADTIERELAKSRGLVINGARVPVPGVAVCTWLDDPKRAPRVTDGGRRDADDVIAFVWHTSKGRLCRTLAPDAIPSTHAETLARYQSRTAREVSWHITVDTDGDVLQQADLALWTCWHAGSANGWTVGGELVQREDAPSTLTAPQIRAAADVTDATCAALGIPRRVLVDAAGEPWVAPVLDLVSPRAVHHRTGAKLGGRGKTWAGVIGHAHQSHASAKNGRGPGDPGPLIFAELIARGYVRHVVGADGRIAKDPLA